jgi:hypothetical protein
MSIIRRGLRYGDDDDEEVHVNPQEFGTTSILIIIDSI